jgi:branched-chain amino acid aminotransferase
MDASHHIPILILTSSGAKKAPYVASSLADAAIHEGEGVYTVGRTFKRYHVLLFDQHLDRLEESARLEGIPAKLDRQAVRHTLRRLIELGDYPESRFRITIPRHAPDHTVISLEPFTPVSPELIKSGVRVAIVEAARKNPQAKTTAWMHQRKNKNAKLPDGVYEGLLTNPQGFILEGLSSNFYAILNGVLHTAGEGVLAGMAQRIVLQVAEGFLPTQMTPVDSKALWGLDEAFLSSASRGIVPIVMINTQIIANGQPGPFTERLIEAYNTWADANLEELPL